MKRVPAKEFSDLVLWQKAHGLVLFIYSLSRTFPKYELYGLTSQIRRAAVSVPANIAEGFKKRTVAEKNPLPEYISGFSGRVQVFSLS